MILFILEENGLLSIHFHYVIKKPLLNHLLTTFLIKHSSLNSLLDMLTGVWLVKLATCFHDKAHLS